MTKHLSVVALALAAFAACEPNAGVTEPRAAVRASLIGPQNDDQRDGDGGPRAVYTITNQVGGNAVAVFAPAGSFSTGGAGTGAGLGSQGAVTLSNDGRLLFTVNAGSNDVSVFRVDPQGLSLLSRTPSGGTLPTSVTVSRNVVYVLNAGGAGNITGFRLNSAGGLAPIAGSTKAFSGGAVAPAQVSFSPDGSQLVVSEKG